MNQKYTFAFAFIISSLFYSCSSLNRDSSDRTIVTRSEFSESLNIRCRDQQDYYAEHFLSEKFTERFSSEIEFYKNMGHDYVIGASDCAVGMWNSDEAYEVVFLFKKPSLRERYLNMTFVSEISQASIFLNGGEDMKK